MTTLIAYGVSLMYEECDEGKPAWVQCRVGNSVVTMTPEIAEVFSESIMKTVHAARITNQEEERKRALAASKAAQAKAKEENGRHQ